MQVSSRPKRFTVSLPPIPCTPEMRQALLVLSNKDQASLTQVLRTGLQHYLEYRNLKPVENRPLTPIQGSEDE